MLGVGHLDKGYLIIFLITILALLATYQIQSVKKIYNASVLKRLTKNQELSKLVLSENDIVHLPAPVQKYLRLMGVIGKEKVRSVRVVYSGKMKMDPHKDWSNFKFEQYNFFDNLARFYYIRGSVNGIPARGLDSYQNGKGNMLIRLGSLITVVDAKGEDMDSAALVTLFNDMCFLAPASLIDDRISWETIDVLTVKATLTDKMNKVSGILCFNEDGELVNFITDDRYYAPMGKESQKVRWSTPIKGYHEINGIKVPSSIEAVWNLDEGDFCYAKINKIREVEFNPKGLK